jgi:chaperonin GroES
MPEERETQQADPKRLQEILTAGAEEPGGVASILEDEELGKYGTQVTKTFDLDVNDPVRVEKAEKWELGQRIVKQTIERKNTPIENASNVKYPLLTTACIQFNARSYPAILQGNNVVKPQMVGDITPPSDEEMAQLQQQGQPQQPPQPGQPPAQQQPQIPPGELQPLIEKMEALRDKQNKADRAAEYMNWQLFNELKEWEEDTDKMLLMLPLYGNMFRKYWNSKSKDRIESKILSPEHLVVPSATKNLEDSPRITEEFTLYPNQVEERIREGSWLSFDYSESSTDTDAEIEFLEQHTWFDLDYDGYKEPYIIIVHKTSGAVAQILPNFQMADVIKNDDGEVRRINKILFYQKYTFIPSSDGGFYDMGFFDILYPLNEVINTTLNQLMDAGRLANSNSGFLAKDAKIKKGSLQFAVGEWKSVNIKGDDLRKGMVPLTFPGPSQTLFQLLGWITDAAREVANIKDVLMGEQAMNVPATTTLALIEQGTKVFSAIHKRIYRSLAGELNILRLWNFRTVDEEHYEDVIDSPVKRSDFDDDGYDFVPVADPEVATDMQKMGRVEFLMSLADKYPEVNRMVMLKRALESANVDGIEEILQPVPNQQEQIKMRDQALQKKAQEQVDRKQGFEEREMSRKEQETAFKELESAAKALEAKAKAVDNIASAEAREAGQQLDQYKADMRDLDDFRRRMVDMAKASGDRMAMGQNQGPAGGDQGGPGQRVIPIRP